jgi:hypothetical protein
MDIIYYNKHARLDVPKLAECFTQITESRKKKLNVGDSIWVDLEPYHPSGKVYGFTMVKITRKQHLPNAILYFYNRSGMEGQTSSSFEIYEVCNQKMLQYYIDTFGKYVTNPLVLGIAPQNYSDLPDFVL